MLAAQQAKKVGYYEIGIVYGDGTCLYFVLHMRRKAYSAGAPRCAPCVLEAREMTPVQGPAALAPRTARCISPHPPGSGISARRHMQTTEDTTNRRHHPADFDYLQMHMDTLWVPDPGSAGLYSESPEIYIDLYHQLGPAPGPPPTPLPRGGCILALPRLASLTRRTPYPGSLATCPATR